MTWSGRRMTVAMLFCASLATGHMIASAEEAPVVLLERVTIEGIENAFRVRSDLYSGGQPTEAGFAELAKLGVKTIISVDGAAPDLELAHRYGMRYVHLPIGYDGVPVEQQRKLVKARQTFAGPVYVHCHHGKHRGPAAVMALCRATDPALSAETARDALKVMGTAGRYAGLYASVAAVRLPTAEELKRISPDLPEKVEASAMVEQMGAIDGAWDRLMGATKKPVATDEERRKVLAVVVELEELVTEAGRLADDGEQALKQDFAEAALQIRKERKALERGAGALSQESVEQLRGRLEQNCGRCHARHRDQK